MKQVVNLMFEVKAFIKFTLLGKTSINERETINWLEHFLITTFLFDGRDNV